jgi:hypothetical protein
MDIKLQTKVNDNNRSQFYQQVYCQQLDTKQQLVDLEMFSNDCVLVDCCGWHYQNVFQDKKIFKLETLKTASQFKLGRNQFNKLIDDRTDNQIKWPTLEVSDPVLIFDRSPMLKYHSLNKILSILSDSVYQYNATDLIVNLNTIFIDDSRVVDRFYNLANISIAKFAVREFLYSARNNKLFIHFKRNYDI